MRQRYKMSGEAYGMFILLMVVITIYCQGNMILDKAVATTDVHEVLLESSAHPNIFSSKQAAHSSRVRRTLELYAVASGNGGDVAEDAAEKDVSSRGIHLSDNASSGDRDDDLGIVGTPNEGDILAGTGSGDAQAVGINSLNKGDEGLDIISSGDGEEFSGPAVRDEEVLDIVISGDTEEVSDIILAPEDGNVLNVVTTEDRQYGLRVVTVLDREEFIEVTLDDDDDGKLPSSNYRSSFNYESLQKSNFHKNTDDHQITEQFPATWVHPAAYQARSSMLKTSEEEPTQLQRDAAKQAHFQVEIGEMDDENILLRDDVFYVPDLHTPEFRGDVENSKPSLLGNRADVASRQGEGYFMNKRDEGVTGDGDAPGHPELEDSGGGTKACAPEYHETITTSACRLNYAEMIGFIRRLLDRLHVKNGSLLVLINSNYSQGARPVPSHVVGDSEAATVQRRNLIYEEIRKLSASSSDSQQVEELWCRTLRLVDDWGPGVVITSTTDVLSSSIIHCVDSQLRQRSKVGDVALCGKGLIEVNGRSGLASKKLCTSVFACWFQIMAGFWIVCVAILLLRWIFMNGIWVIRMCCQLPAYMRTTSVMRAINCINCGMDEDSWNSRSAYPEGITAGIEAGLRQLFSRCDVTLLLVGSLSSRLGKSVSARPEAEDSLQEYKFTDPVLGADADFMVVLQVPVAPAEAGQQGMSAQELSNAAIVYRTVDPANNLARSRRQVLSPRCQLQHTAHSTDNLQPNSPGRHFKLANTPETDDVSTVVDKPKMENVLDEVKYEKDTENLDRSGRVLAHEEDTAGDATGRQSARDRRGINASDDIKLNQMRSFRTSFECLQMEESSKDTHRKLSRSTSNTEGSNDHKVASLLTTTAMLIQSKSIVTEDLSQMEGDMVVSVSGPSEGWDNRSRQRWQCAEVISKQPALNTCRSDINVACLIEQDMPLQRRSTYSEPSAFRRRLTLAVAPHESSTPGFARVRLFEDRVLSEDRRWWVENLSETCAQDGLPYLSSKKARSVMEEMFRSLPIDVERDRKHMSIVDSCVDDYRGVPSYTKEVTARGPAVTLRLVQSDDRVFSPSGCWGSSWLHCGLCLCGAVLLLPFFLWIFLTAGSWPARKCSGGACCSIYYFVTLLIPMALVLPATLFVLNFRPGNEDEMVYVYALLSYVALSACLGSIFVCTSQCFFKLPTIFYGDFVTALVCPTWPDDARRFINRPRHWPKKHDVDMIVRRGCHLVPKPPTNCSCTDIHGTAPCCDAHLLWRYSFSQAELTLSKSIPEHYRRAYVTLKWIVKKYIIRASRERHGQPDGFMRSYYLKTVLFWELESAPALAPPINTEDQVLRRLAERLQRHIQQRHLPHFFVPDVNLFDELTARDFRRTENLLYQVLEDPAALLDVRELRLKFGALVCCEAIFCTPGRDHRSELCCNYASRLHTVW